VAETPPAAPPPEPPPPPPPATPAGPAPAAPRRSGGLLPGLVLSVLLHVLQVPLGLVVGALLFALARTAGGGEGLALYVSIVAGASLLLIGLSQLVYMVPAIVIARRRGRVELAQGLAIGLAVIFLLNAGCWGLFGATAVFG
jgi:hypothetical protein